MQLEQGSLTYLWILTLRQQSIESGAVGMSQTSGALTMSLGLLERALDAVGQFVAADVAAKNGGSLPAPSLSGNLENAATHLGSSPDFGSPLPPDAPLAIESSEAASSSPLTVRSPRPRSQHPSIELQLDANVDARLVNVAQPLPASAEVLPYSRRRRKRKKVTREGFVASDLRGLSFGESDFGETFSESCAVHILHFA